MATSPPRCCPRGELTCALRVGPSGHAVLVSRQPHLTGDTVLTAPETRWDYTGKPVESVLSPD